MGGKTMGVCLGDEFSVRWMEDADASDRAVETLTQQYSKDKTRVTKSHPQHFGDFSFGSDPIGDYVGESNKTVALPEASNDFSHGAGVSSRDAELAMLQWRLEEAKRGSRMFNYSYSAAAVQREQMRRDHADEVFSAFWGTFNNGASLSTMQYKPPRDFSCLKSAGKAVEEIFMPWNDYSLKYVGVISNLCESGISATQIASSLQTLRSTNADGNCEERYQPSDCQHSSASRHLMGGGGGGGECTWCESTATMRSASRPRHPSNWTNRIGNATTI